MKTPTWFLECTVTKSNLSGKRTYAQNYAYALQQVQQQSHMPFSVAALFVNLL